METRIEGRVGWIEVTHERVHVLAKGDDGLRERLRVALDAAGDESLADVLTDELTTGGVRRAPDFAILDTADRRVLVRGSAVVRVTGSDGTTREVLAPARGPWADEDLAEGTDGVLLTAGALPGDGAGPTPAAAPEPAAPAGWAMPSVFGAPAGRAEDAAARPPLSVVADAPQGDSPREAEPDTPVEEGLVVETPAPRGQDIADLTEEPRPEGRGGDEPAARVSEDDEELPSFDFLFGNTSHHRSSLLSGLEAEEADAPSIDSGPVAAAGGFQPREDAANATLAPPDDDEEPDRAEAEPEGGPPLSAAPGDLPPMPGSAPSADPPSPVEPVEAPAAAAPAAPAGGRHPQFVDGHLVGGRVDPGPGPGAAPDPAPSLPQPDDGGMISAVPWARGAPAATGAAADRADAPGRPARGPAGVEDPAVDTGEIPSGPMVLAVRCGSGHHNAPHATRCRVCGQDLPTQQPEQTPRPALGLLRLSTGDVVTLDRGVLIGRAPRAAAEASGARAPHLVRIASPDNEISRNHVEVVLDGWHVLVRDLGSTNGTTVALPGSSPVRVRPGDQQTIEPGTTITLADQVSMVFEVTG